ncbi:hypothetical protein AG1IA_01387 [Rhizoctonia solani AG-1 IA]|uniref:Uncharacterized protein n=1 Tax=Thanatephorus cucumeris (strain AG1-IA) TaxID=983506 RepID=L8X306_THACA|nr:hypothetical protein AG1IA_01387 [Rhizoctonia solani AG-1 IA]
MTNYPGICGNKPDIAIARRRASPVSSADWRNLKTSRQRDHSFSSMAFCKSRITSSWL